jgi:hypothetical protein
MTNDEKRAFDTEGGVVLIWIQYQGVLTGEN